MIDHQNLLESAGIDNSTAGLKKFLNATRSRRKGCERGKFKAKVVLLMGRGGQLRVEREFGWDRKTIIEGTKELTRPVSTASIILADAGGIDASKNCRIFLTISSKLLSR